VPSLAVFAVTANTVIPALLQQYAYMNIPRVPALPLLYAGCVFVVVWHVAYFGLLIREFVDHFQIGFLRIKKVATA